MTWYAVGILLVVSPGHLDRHRHRYLLLEKPGDQVVVFPRQNDRRDRAFAWIPSRDEERSVLPAGRFEHHACARTL